MTIGERPYVSGLTIDSPTSCDLDDAIWVERTDDSWLVLVSIADVASHVKQESECDEEALRRVFTNFYLAGNRPMLPRQLAEERLSLLPSEIRDTFTFSFELDAAFELISIDIARTKLRSKAKMSYEAVEQLLDRPEDEHHQFWVDCLNLAQGLLRKRHDKDALSATDLEKEMMGEDEGSDSLPQDGEDCRAHLIVQELMILVNHAATIRLLEAGLTLILRSHRCQDSPQCEELAKKEARYVAGSANDDSRHEGHFGLKLAYYAHLTSPIRRYADLANQRILHAWLDNRSSPYSEQELQELAHYLNVKTEEHLEARKDISRSRAINNLLAAGPEDLLALVPREFSFFIEKLCDETLAIDSDLAEIVLERIQAKNISTVDITRILFVQFKNVFWNELKKAASKWLANDRELIVQVFRHAHTFCGWPAVEDLDLRVDRFDDRHIPRYVAEVSLTHDGQSFRSETVTGMKIKEIKREAIFSLIDKISGVRLGVSTCDKPEPKGFDSKASARLHQISQIAKVPQAVSCLIGQGPGHQKRFTCVTLIRIRGETFRSSAKTASSKKIAKHLAAADLVAKIPEDSLRPTRKRVPAKNKISPGKALSKWLKLRRCPRAVFAFEKAKGKRSILHCCSCCVTIDKRKLTWRGLGVTKKAAKNVATRKALNGLRNL